MHRIHLAPFLLSALLLGACSAPAAEDVATSPDDMPTATVEITEATSAPPETASPSAEPSSGEEPTAAPSDPGEVADISTYRDEAAGFAFDHPVDWIVGGLAESHSRGDISQLTRDDEVVLDIAVLRWDPVSDLEAYLDTRMTAWTASGFSIVSEERLPLGAESEAVFLVLEDPEGRESANYIAPIGDRYLSLSGMEVDAIRSVARTVRLLDDAGSGDSDAGSDDEARSSSADLVTAIDCRTSDTASLDYVACNIQDAIRASNLYAAEGYMADPFGIGYWRSEGVRLTPAEAVAEMDASRLPADRSAITFEADPSAFPDLGGMDPAAIMGPEIGLRLMLYSQGWGPDGQGEAILYFTEGEEGYLWHSLLFSGQPFDQ
jgi:hypothetical protein